MSPPPPEIPLPHQLAKQNDDSDPTRSRFNLPSKGQFIKFLTLTQNTSAMVFTIFLIPHLASPLVASVAGLEGADKTMMISRDLYIPLEPIIIYIPIGIHITSSILRRLIIIFYPNPNEIKNWKKIKNKLPKQIHQIIAYPLIILIINHYLTHRLIPSFKKFPINSLSPSELNWEFIGYNLNNNLLSWLNYLILIGFTSWHSIIGSMKIISFLKGSSPLDKFEKQLIIKENNNNNNNKNEEEEIIEISTKSNSKNRKIPKKRQVSLNALVFVILGITTIGLYRVKKDTGIISPLMKIRYDAIFQFYWK
ncbi:uncharacterized protein I206_102486 [Kwoniella pini CBS 10737]|uniref:Mitochondrial adapter protein MCP1 transmembrane domain-containing protein n=1 Tax=Kwoniella pini CBS 10737 TaxID=1296096 RepID=A0A1B9I5P4_9TREE|nr:uncharacterized protein I206_02837 [Kwoniella pini CBS 10737]OCF50781.1 hypothetical protein I206_02837 [Kwoniella pini CBS 10737]